MEKERNRVARSVRCVECDKSFEIDGPVETVFCGHCGHRQRISPALLREMRDFRVQVDAHTYAAADDLGSAAAFERTAYQVKTGMRPGQVLLAIGLTVGIPMGLILLGVALIEGGVIPAGNDAVIGALGMGGSLIGFVAYMVVYFSRGGKKQSAAIALSTQVRCPECGATNSFAGSNDTATCTHCGAGLIPETATHSSVIESAVQQRRQAHMMKIRAEREGYAVYAGVGVKPLTMVWIIGGPFVLMTGGASIGWTVEMLTGEEPFHPAIFVMWTLFIGVLLTVVLITRHMMGKRARIKQVMSELATALSGWPLNGIGDVVDWLNAYWPETVNPLKFFPGQYFGAAEMNIGGYPVLVDVNPIAASDKHMKYSNVRVACHIPSQNDGALTVPQTGQAGAIKSRLNAEGFSVALCSAGILLEADDGLLHSLKIPENILSLADPITDAARLAAALNAVPGEQIP